MEEFNDTEKEYIIKKFAPSIITYSYRFNGYQDMSDRLTKASKDEFHGRTSKIISRLTDVQEKTLIKSTPSKENPTFGQDDLYDISERFDTIGRYKFAEKTKKFIAQNINTDIDLQLNVYKKAKELYHQPSILNIPSIIRATRFSKKCCFTHDVVAGVFVNMPYEYYSGIHTWENFLYVNHNNEIVCTGDKSEKQTCDFVATIATEGIQNPLFFKIKNGTIVSANDCYGRLYAAMLLKIPEIPVVVYTTGLVTDDFEDYVPQDNYDRQEKLRKICAPEMIF